MRSFWCAFITVHKTKKKKDIGTFFWKLKENIQKLYIYCIKPFIYSFVSSPTSLQQSTWNCVYAKTEIGKLYNVKTPPKK